MRNVRKDARQLTATQAIWKPANAKINTSVGIMTLTARTTGIGSIALAVIMTIAGATIMTLTAVTGTGNTANATSGFKVQYWRG